MDLSDEFILSAVILEDNFHSGTNELNNTIQLEGNINFPESVETSETLPAKPQCKYCFKTFATFRQCNGHQRIHSKEKIFTCEKCPHAGFMTKEEFKAHQACQKRNFLCPKCPMSFFEETILKRHLQNIHYKSRTHKCIMCDKSFFAKSDLEIHLAVHMGRKKYHCAECGKKFVHMSNYLRHSRIHTNCKPYVCSICDVGYIQFRSLKEHIRRMHFLLMETEAKDKAILEAPSLGNEKQPRKYHCGQCGEILNNNSELVQHFASAHSRPESANEMLNEIVKDFNKNSSNLGETVDALLKGILSEDTNDVDSICTNNMNSLYSDVRLDHGHSSNNWNNVSIMATTNSATEPEMQCDNLMFDDKFTGNMDDFELLSCNSIELPDHSSQIKFEILDDLSQNLFDGHLGNCRESNHSDDSNLKSLCTDLGGSMLQNIEIYLPSRNDSTSNDETINFDSLDNSSFVESAVDYINLPTAIEAQCISNIDIDTDCATVFESDVDLEQSSLLAENLNQLIEQNGVEFISADDSDIYVISLNTAIDAEKLGSLLNIDYVQISSVDNAPNEDTVTNEIETPALVQNAEQKPQEQVNQVKEVKISKQKSSNKTKNVKLKTNEVYICQTCNKTFKNKYNYKDHLGLHNRKYRKHKCEECNQRFSWKSSLNKHIKSQHMFRKLLGCDLCQRNYKTNTQVSEHKRREHIGEKSHRCPEPNCPRNFFKKHDLKLHLRTHTKERPFACTLCPRRFSHPSHLRRHERTPYNSHSAAAPLLCGECGRAFHQLAALSNHKLHCGNQVPIIASNASKPSRSVTKSKTPQVRAFDSDFSTQLLSDIEDVLKIDMTVHMSEEN